MTIEKDIIKACIKDDRKAMEQLYEYCFHLLMPNCFRFHRNEEDARSSFNLGFMKIIGALKKLDLESSNFNAWAKRVMNNILIDEYRKSKKQRERYIGTENERELDFHADNDDNAALSNLGEQNIMNLVKELPIVTGQVFCLYVIDGYSHREIGKLLDFAEGTSKWHLSQARKSLREKLEKLESRTKKNVV
jgi:RNA polymerase sigma factor (sigma-70 family)